MLSFIGKTLAGIGLALVSFLGIHNTPLTAPVAGSYSPTGAGTYYLEATITNSQNTINLTSFDEPVSNIPYTMSYLGSTIEYGTISPQSGRSEFVSFSGITQNTDGSATLTGVVRGLSRSPGSGGCVASSTLASGYAGQTKFILSNPPCQLAQYAVKQNNEEVSGLWTFDQSPIGINPGGQPNSSETVNGVSQLATGAQAAAGTSSGSTGARLVLPASAATSTCQSAANSVLVASSTTGKLDGNCVNGAYSYTFSGRDTFSGGVITTASSTHTATTSIPASSVTNNALILNGIAYKFPGTQGASSTALSTDGSGSLSWEPTAVNYLIGTTPASTTPYDSGNEITAATVTVPANTLGTGNAVQIQLPFDTLNNINTANNATVKMYYGATSISCVLAFTGTLSGSNGNVLFSVIGNGSTGSQILQAQVSLSSLGSTNLQSTASPSGICSTKTTASIDSTANQILKVTNTWNSNTSGTPTITYETGIVSLIK